MFYFKGCTKCHGDLHLEEDVYGSFYKCLQCGRIVDVEGQKPGQEKEAVEGVAALAA